MKRVLFAWGAMCAAGVFLLYGLTVTGKTGAEIWEKQPPKKAVITKQFTEREEQILMRIATAEAEGEGVEGMRKVLEVVLNRVESPNYPDSIEEVVYQDKPCIQFESLENGRYDTCIITADAKRAFDSIASAGVRDNKIIAYEVVGGDVLTKWYDFAYSVGNHRFYTEKGAQK